MSITIIKQGILDTVQDCGRYGYSAMGINPGGVMDPFAASVANFLAGNTNNEPVIELHFPAMQVLFHEPALISICGADFTSCIHEEPIPTWQPVMVNRNALLHFQKWRWGARAYLAIHGGFKMVKWLGSYSTNIKGKAGGYFGRPLAKDDLLHVNMEENGDGGFNPSCYLSARQYYRTLHWGVHEKNVYAEEGNFLIIPGPEFNWLDEASKYQLLHSTFSVAPHSDRMGYLLNGQSLHPSNHIEMISSGVDTGTIQLLPNGQLMILMADRQTTGGYPRIGNIIGAHLPKLAQLHSGAELRFQLTDIATAEQMLFSQMRNLRIIERSCHDHFNQLYAHN
ncbi:MAG TPA: biotin-dependent carboxyltransferase family protein [Chitinophagaceae bacterium]